MADVLLSVNRLLHLVARSDGAANRHREEQGLPLDRMDVEGVRHRPTPGQHPPALADLSGAQTMIGVTDSASVEDASQLQDDTEVKGQMLIVYTRETRLTKDVLCEQTPS